MLVWGFFPYKPIQHENVYLVFLWFVIGKDVNIHSENTIKSKFKEVYMKVYILSISSQRINNQIIFFIFFSEIWCDFYFLIYLKFFFKFNFILIIKFFLNNI